MDMTLTGGRARRFGAECPYFGLLWLTAWTVRGCSAYPLVVNSPLGGLRTESLVTRPIPGRRAVVVFLESIVPQQCLTLGPGRPEEALLPRFKTNVF